MKRQTLKIPQKKQIVKERNRRQQRGEHCTNGVLAEWAKREFNLATVPGKAVMSRILNDKELATEDGSASGLGSSVFRRRGAKHVELERALYDWVCDMRNSRRCISGALIQAKAAQLAQKANERLSRDSQITIQFSEGWLARFKQRWSLKAFRLHGEAGDVDEANLDSQSEPIRQKIESYALKNVFNCDESGLFYQMAPDRTIAPSAFAGRKSQKARFTFLACCNADGTEKLPLMFIGTSRNPRCFKKKSREQLGLYYRNNKKAWMNSSLFFEWLRYVDMEIGKTEGRKILLVMDNCSAHGTTETVSQLDHVEVAFLPPNTTSKLQPLDAGIIAAMKVRYRRRQMERAVDLLDVGDMDIYKNDILTAMNWLTTIWKDVTEATIRNCWGTTGIVPAYDYVAPVHDRDDTEDDRAAVERFVQIAVPFSSRRIPIAELLSRDDAVECTQVYTDDDMVDNIVSADAEDSIQENDDDEGEADLGTLQEQLRAIAQVKWICDARGVAEKSFMKVMREVQSAVRAEQQSSLEQSTIDQFFGRQQ